MSSAMGALPENIRAVRSRLLPGVELVVVSKYRPLERLMACYREGERRFAESRPMEFEAKVGAMPSDVEWHFIGHLQTNKLRHVLPYVSMVQSVDSSHLLDAIENYGAAHGCVTDILLEVHIGIEEAKHGFAPEDVEKEIGRVVAQGFSHVRLRGLMGMASNTSDTARIDGEFALLEGLFKRMRETFPTLTFFDQLSMGMSNDYTLAQRHGATMVRVGSAIFETLNNQE